MRKSIFWVGIIIFILGLFLIFISGSSSGLDMKPTVPFLYNNLQLQPFYLIAGIAGFILAIVGLIMKKRR